MKLSRIIPDSPRIRGVIETPAKSKSQVELRAQAFELEQKMKSLEEKHKSELLAFDDQSQQIRLNSNPIETKQTEKDEASAISFPKDVVSFSSKNELLSDMNKMSDPADKINPANYKNQAQKIKAAKIEEMTQRFFLQPPRIKNAENDQPVPKETPSPQVM